ncbi:flavin reductase family protein [Aeromicrobium sp. CTD01-1L150]|uniref:flavin reductase family protein n=1 Tax=Aeromicrobium sp. CTD01-1L150 TaxID=3341830 RepID=UPI0035BFE516
MAVEAADLDPAAAYRLLTGVVVPRPVAWITSRDAEGVLNLAPFSAFTMVSNDPPMVGVNIGRRAGRLKDTAANIETSGEFVVNIPDWTMHEQVHESSWPHPSTVDELAELGLRTVDSDVVKVPRLADVPASLECRFDRFVSFGRAGSRFTVGEVMRFHVAEELLVDGKIDTAELDPTARLAGPTYGRIGATQTLAPVPTTIMAVRQTP